MKRLAFTAFVSLVACDAPTTTPLELHSVTPTQGTARGGQRIKVTGAGFDDSTTATLGGHAARVVDVTDTTLTVVTPSGVAGPAMLEVTVGEQKTKLADAYTYERLRFSLVDAAEVTLEAGPVEGALAATADLDGDGDDDVFQAVRKEGVTVLVNDGAQLVQRFVDVAQADGGVGFTSDAWAVAPADFDGDGVVDLFIGTTGKSRTVLLRGTQSGAFDDASEDLPVLYGSSQRPLVLDTDGDGDLDVLLTGTTTTADGAATVMLLLNDGEGRFTDGSAKLAGPKLAASGIVAGDLDSDGDTDLFFAMRDESCRLFLGDGQGVFQLAAPDALPVDSQPRAGMPTLGDLNRDGFLDLYVPTDTQDQVWLNDGTAHFANLTEAHLSPEVQPADGARFVDVDLDGHLDVVVMERQGRLRFLRNDGVGRLFDYSPDVVGNDAPARDVVVVDVQRDGVPELFASRAGLSRPALFVSAADEEDSDKDGWVDSVDVCVDNKATTQAHRAPFGCRSKAECEAKTGCELKVFGASAYLSCDAAVTFEAAEALCEKHGALLAEINSAAENAALTAGLPGASWFALDDRATEGTWRGNGAPLEWTNWGMLQPDNAGTGGEDCGSLRPDGFWNDLPCTNTARTLCETARTPVALSDAACPMSADAGVGP